MFMKLYHWYKRKKTRAFVFDNEHIAKSAIILPTAMFRFTQKSNCVRITIGEESMVGCNFIFESEQGCIKIGKKTYIGGGTNIISRKSIEIGDDVTIAWGVWIYDHNSHSLDWRERVNDIEQQNDDYRNGRNFIANKNWDVVKSAPIKICDKAWIGFNAIILKGVTIGEGAVVGAGAVVAEDVPPWSVVAGNPAKIVKMIQENER